MSSEERFFEDIVNNASDLIQCVDASGRFAFVNRMWLQKMEYDPNELLTLSLWDIIHPDSIDHCQMVFQQVMMGHPVDFIEAIFVTKSKNALHVEGAISTKRDESGRVVSTRGIFRDITEGKRQNIELTRLLKEQNDQFVLQALFTNVLSEFVQSDSTLYESKIHSALASFGKFVKADRVYIFDYDFDKDICINTHEWCEENISPQIDELQEVPLSLMSTWVDAHRLGNPILIPNVNDLPEDDTVRGLLEPQAVKSLITIPMMEKNVLKGFIGFDSVKELRSYTQHEQGILAALSNLLLGIKQKMILLNELNKKQQELRLEEQRIRSIIDSTTDIIFEIDSNKRYVRMFGRGIDLLHIDPSQYLGKTALEVYGPIAKINDEHHNEVLRGREVQYQWQRRFDNRIFHLDTRIAPIRDETGLVIGGAGIVRDITEAMFRQEEIKRLSNHDFLTDLHNRRYFTKRLIEADEDGDYPIGLIMLDVNGLKLINDVFGHQSGDKALICFSNILREVFTPRHVVARIGGDEFAVFLSRTSIEEMDEKIHLLKEKVAMTKIESIDLSIGIGHHLKTDRSIGLDEVMRLAENNMYKSKIVEGRSMRNSAIRSILETLTEKYTEERIHSERVGSISKKIGEAMAMRSDEIRLLEVAGTLHDIGKIATPDAILTKPSRLTPEEYDIIKNHTETGYQILKAADEYTNLAEYALTHHEHWNGNGYPMKLKGEEIPLFSRIIGIADAYEAMTSNRPYRKAMSMESAIDELKRYAGTQFDPRIVDIFIKQVLQKT